jgi:hypothetical protein
MKPSLSFISLMIVFGCSDKPKPDNIPFSNPFAGVYINTRTGTDTINFDYFPTSPTIYLRRQPKTAVGFYRFTIKDDKINVQWGFASKTDTTWYAFRMKGDSLMIGNFYDQDRRDEVELFVRTASVEKE